MRFCVWCFSPLCSAGGGAARTCTGAQRLLATRKRLCSILAASSSDAFFPFREWKAQRGLIIVTSKCVFCFSLSLSERHDARREASLTCDYAHYQPSF